MLGESETARLDLTKAWKWACARWMQRVATKRVGAKSKAGETEGVYGSNTAGRRPEGKG